MCHTPPGHGEAKPGFEYAGGVVFVVPQTGRVVSANITPDSDTGIGNWSRDFFIARFQDVGAAGERWLPVKDRRFNTVMPWTTMAGMTEDDLDAIYSYLRSVPPVRNPVTTFPDPR